MSRPVRRPPGQPDHRDGRIVGKDLTIPASPTSPKIQLRPIPKTITVSRTTSLLPASLYPEEWQSLPTVPLDEVSAIGLKKTMERPDAERYIRYARSLSIFDETKRERPLTDDEKELRRQTEWSLLALCGARKAAARIEARQSTLILLYLVSMVGTYDALFLSPRLSIPVGDCRATRRKEGDLQTRARS